MTDSPNLYGRLELLWWIITALLATLIMIPVLLYLPDYPFYWINVFFIAAFITLTRYLFLLRYTWLARRQIVKIIIVFICIPFIFYCVQELNRFQTFLDEEGFEAIVGGVERGKQAAMITYVRSETLLFGVGAVISGILLPLRLIVSVWRQHNKVRD